MTYVYGRMNMWTWPQYAHEEQTKQSWQTHSWNVIIPVIILILVFCLLQTGNANVAGIMKHSEYVYFILHGFMAQQQ
jgi:hypothetical protein